MVSEYHLNENLHNRWDRKDFKEGLQNYLRQTFQTHLELVSTIKTTHLSGTPEDWMKKLLLMKCHQMIPLNKAPEYLVESDFANDFLSVYKVNLDECDWILKVTTANKKMFLYQFVIFSVNNVCTMGRISYDLQFSALNPKECALTWKISHSSDLDPSIANALIKKRDEVLANLGESKLEARL